MRGRFLPSFALNNARWVFNPARGRVQLEGAAMQTRNLACTRVRLDIPTWPPPPIPQSPVGPSDDLTAGPSRATPGLRDVEAASRRRWYQDWVHSPSFQAALTTVVGLAMVFGAGVGYLQWYKGHVLRRVSR